MDFRASKMSVKDKIKMAFVTRANIFPRIIIVEGMIPFE
jgi:hypothetical protein